MSRTIAYRSRPDAQYLIPQPNRDASVATQARVLIATLLGVTGPRKRIHPL